jgi:hypothetical protein
MMSDWKLVSADASDQLVRLHHFAITKRQPEGDIEFRITVREHATPQERGMHFYATADKQTNQTTAPFTPCGWGPSLEIALEQCIIAIHRFPYEGDPAG